MESGFEEGRVDFAIVRETVIATDDGPHTSWSLLHPIELPPSPEFSAGAIASIKKMAKSKGRSST